nr:WYL domain-containing protein [uncultured Dyadobacter sp.]
MTEQQKLLRLFKLIRLLKQRPGKTIDQLAQSLEKDRRTIYRYLNLLEEVGYEIDKKGEPSRYFLFEDETWQKPLFTEDESELLRRAITGIPASHALLPGIRQKLFMSSTLLPLADGLMDIHQARLLEQLAKAIDCGRQVALVRYQSTNSNTVTDRIVESLSFTDDYNVLVAYEPAAGKEKTFKIRRMEEVVLLDTPCQYRGAGAAPDLFDWAGPEKIRVELALTKRAYHLLIEDFPPSRAFTGQRADTAFPYFFKGEVRGFQGVGRFILGLPGEVRVIEPEDLREYLKGRVGEFLLG